jgi:hypothetical protein
VPPVLREVNDRLKEIWMLKQGNEEALTTDLDNFICTHQYGVIKEINNFTESKEKDNNKKPPNKGNKNNRNTRKRFSYERCQDIFKECPKRLADVVTNNDRAYLEPARQPPAAADIKRLYEDLWRQTGPSNNSR